VTDSNLPDPEIRDLLRELAAADAPAVLERARSRARARAERLIEDALVDELLGAAASQARAARAPADGGAARVNEPAADQPEVGGAWWTYCVTWDEGAVELASGLEGVEPGSEVEAVCDGHLAALVSRVPLAEYGDARLREHLEDLEWVERTARRHEGVLETALQDATVVPLRLCTLYRELDGVRRLLREHRPAFRDGLRQVEGCVEWGVKLFADPRAPVNEPAAAPAGNESRGATYLSRRQQERVLAEKASEARARCVDVVHQRFAALSRASTINPPQRPEVHGRELSMVMNGAYLVERGRHGELEDTAASLREEWTPLGFTLELTGPWPPYNFVSATPGVIS
jgi:gas vesicle protein GvpL/GvpF